MDKRSRERRNRFFSAVARFYQPGLDLWTGGGHSGFHGEVVKELDLKPGLKVLDLGCGVGRVARMAARVVGSQGEVTGVDASENMIRIARNSAGGFPNLSFVHSDVEHYDPGKGGSIA
ncbi:MAG: methyltransferase domain-containing protein [bacterium]|nr:methyltransferase domain-containing protein [bacterium]